MVRLRKNPTIILNWDWLDLMGFVGLGCVGQITVYQEGNPKNQNNPENPNSNKLKQEIKIQLIP